MKGSEWTEGMPIVDKILFNEAGIYIKQYNDGQDNRLDIDISGHYDKDALIELKRKINSLEINDSLTEQTERKA